MNFYKRFPGDYASDTKELSLLEHGVYTILLDVLYSTEKPLPNNFKLLCRIVGATKKGEVSALKVVLRKHFHKNLLGYSNTRFEKELKLASSRIKAAKLNGRQGGRPPKQKPSVNLEHNPEKSSPDSRLQTSDEESRSTLFSQDPSIKPLHSSRSAQARKTPFLDGMELDAEMIEFANAKHVDPIPEFDKFRDHHKAKGSLMKDWKAAWRTWVRRSPEFNGGNNNGSARPVPKTFDQLRNERTDAALRRVREHYLQGTSKMLT